MELQSQQQNVQKETIKIKCYVEKEDYYSSSQFCRFFFINVRVSFTFSEVHCTREDQSSKFTDTKTCCSHTVLNSL